MRAPLLYLRLQFQNVHLKHQISFLPELTTFVKVRFSLSMIVSMHMRDSAGQISSGVLRIEFNTSIKVCDSGAIITVDQKCGTALVEVLRLVWLQRNCSIKVTDRLV